MNECRIHRRQRFTRLCMIVLLASCVGCGSSDDRRSVEILVSGDTAGWITPCGCAANQSGGLARRATLLANCGAPESVLYLDAGGSAAGTTEYQQLKLEAILRGLQAMNLAAHNIGGPEAALDPDELAALASKTGVTWLSANLRSTRGQSPAQKHLILKRNAVRFAVTGVVAPELVENNAWSAQEPVSAILETLGDVEADVRIVLAYFDEPDLRFLAQSLPEVDFIIGGPTGQAMKPAAVGPVTVLSATNKGKFLARIQLSHVSGQPHQPIPVGPAEVTSDLAENAAQIDNLERYYATLAQRDFTVAEAGLVSRLEPGSGDYRIAGSESCAKCHAEDAKSWHASRHRHAWDVLVAKGAHVDPYCQQCHTTGYGHEQGFVSVSRTPQLVHVGCENCHGPSSAHAANPKTKTPFLAAEQCLGCHDHENSPLFAFDSYWPKILHGTKEAAKVSEFSRENVPTQTLAP